MWLSESARIRVCRSLIERGSAAGSRRVTRAASERALAARRAGVRKERWRVPAFAPDRAMIRIAHG
jgi:hypothetical protein